MFETYTTEDLNKGLEIAKKMAEEANSAFYMNMVLEIMKELSKRG